jgi:aminoglycoside phosphotransferase (APT) family kinase protein
MSAIPAQTLAWVEHEVGKIRTSEPMPEASHTNHRLAIETLSGGELLAVLRLYTDEDLRSGDPWYVPSREVEALGALGSVDVPVPRLVVADPEGRECDVPTLLLTWVPGAPPGRPDDYVAFVRGLAEPLPAIHRAPCVQRTYETYIASDGEQIQDLRPPAWAADPGVWERAFEAATREMLQAPSRFIHRDYHHGNTLWEGGRLTGIVDWTTGCSGPVGIDLAQMRVNLAWEFDLQTADEFLVAWREVADDPSEYDPYWDLLDAVDWLGDGEPNEPVPEGGLERYEAFVARTLAELT